MIPYFISSYANPSNINNILAVEISKHIEDARKKIALLVGADSQEIYFNSGSTEAINTVLKGVFYNYTAKGKKIITTAAEHTAVLQTCDYLRTQGAEIITIPIDKNGLIDLECLEAAIDNNTIAVCVMFANNETGILQDIRSISELAHRHGAIVFSDTTQAVGKIPINFREMGIDAACMSAHKFHGPKGVGAVYLSRKQPRVSILPLLHGGGQERGLRAGTYNVPGIIGLAKSLEIAVLQMHENTNHILQIKNYLESEMKAAFSATILGEEGLRTPNTVSVMFPTISNIDLLKKTKTKFALALGSACSARLGKTSHVIKAMGYTEAFAKHTCRISLSKYNTKEEATLFIEMLKTIL